MRKIFILVLTALCFQLSAQNAELVETVTKQTTYDNKSYIYTKSVRILPPVGGGSFRVRASEHGPFFIQPAAGAGLPQNVPPSMDKNFSRTETILVKDVTNEDQIVSLSSEKIAVNYDYVDALGRSWQSISRGSSPQGKDVVKYSAYESTGRSPRGYLPYVATSASGAFQSNAVSDQSGFYGPSGLINDSRPFTESVFDDSPLNRITKTFSPGGDWYTNNKASSVISKVDLSGTVRFWEYNETTKIPSLVVYNNPSGNYPSKTLIVTEATGEADRITKTYTNFFGQTVLTEVQDVNGSWLQTYSVYDGLGRVRVVFPPEATANISAFFSATSDVERQAFLDQWAYQNIYDGHGRLSKKKVPGSGWSYFVYDNWDRVVLSQSAEQRTSSQGGTSNLWSFTKYDRFNRVAVTGVFTTGTSHTTLQTDAMAISDVNRFETQVNSGVGYTLTSSFPTTGITPSNVDVVNFYDNYDFVNSGWDPEYSAYTYQNVPGYPQSSEKMSSVKGYQTGSRVRVLGQNPDKWLNSVIYYNQQYLPLQSIDEADIGGVIRSMNVYDFVGRIEKNHRYNSYSSLSEEYTYTYDKAGRALQTKHSINGATPVIIVSNRYDELGQLVEKNLHSTDGGTSYLQSIDYLFNIRGWITRINNSSLAVQPGDTQNDLFGMEIKHNPPTGSPLGGAFTTKKYFDGNISSVQWKSNTMQTGVTPIERIYGFDYDALSRLKYAYSAANSSGAWSAESGMFDEQVTGYDRHGNITGLNRYGKADNTKTLIDQLTYTYTLAGKKTDRLVTVDDNTSSKLGFRPASANATEEYSYDNDGNLKFDHNKSISSVTYNYLNLPTMVEFVRSSGQIDRIYYTYDGLGNKLSRRININGSDVWLTSYSKNYQYDNSSQPNSNRLSFFSHPEGRVLNAGNGYEYEYFLTDYLGNARVGFGAFNETASYRATMEPGLSSVEQNQGFRNLNETRPTIPTVNHTPVSQQTPSPDRAAQCNGLAGTPIGPAKYLRVLNGDAVYMEVQARYDQQGSNTTNIIPSVLISALTNVISFNIPNSGETAKLWSGFNTNAPAAAVGLGQVSTTPKAYLVYLFFDDAHNFIRFGAKGISDQAHGKFEKLFRSFTATSNGHLYMYVANESNQADVNVFFDEMSIVHQKSNSVLQVTQATDYYPFGLPFNEYNSDRLFTLSTDAENPQNNVYGVALRNRSLFQGKEFEKDINLNWYDFDARMYEPALGRFNGVDPLANKFNAWSPYNFTLNNPVMYVDPTGTEPYGYWYPWHSAGMKAQRHFDASWSRAQYIGSQQFQIQQQMWAPMAADFQQRFAHYGGDPFYKHVPYFQRWLSGEEGRVAQGLAYTSAIVANVLPGMSLVNGILDARKGDYGRATLNMGSSVLGLSAFSYLTKVTPMHTLYRAVSEAELTSIQQANAFSVVAKSVPGKYFAHSAEDAVMWGKNLIHGWDKEPFYIVQARIPKAYKFDQTWGSGFDGSKMGAVYVDYNNLGAFNSSLNGMYFPNYTPYVYTFPSVPY
jgi:RHS repeat-associated protein